MNDIKFRAWDKDNGRFILSGWQFKVTNDGVFWLDPEIADDRWKLLNPRRFEPPQQFTGLKDKNGKEIYEGDIVKTAGGTIYSIHSRPGLFTICKDGDPEWQIANQGPTAPRERPEAGGHR